MSRIALKLSSRNSLGKFLSLSETPKSRPPSIATLKCKRRKEEGRACSSHPASMWLADYLCSSPPTQATAFPLSSPHYNVLPPRYCPYSPLTQRQNGSILVTFAVWVWWKLVSNQLIKDIFPHPMLTRRNCLCMSLLTHSLPRWKMSIKWLLTKRTTNKTHQQKCFLSCSDHIAPP